MLLVSGTIATYVTIYMTTYALDTLHLSAGVAFGVGIISALGTVIFSTVAGILSDRFGRRPVMLWPTLVAVAISWPTFWLIRFA